VLETCGKRPDLTPRRYKRRKKRQTYRASKTIALSASASRRREHLIQKFFGGKGHGKRSVSPRKNRGWRTRKSKKGMRMIKLMSRWPAGAAWGGAEEYVDSEWARRE